MIGKVEEADVFADGVERGERGGGGVRESGQGEDGKGLWIGHGW